MLPPRDRGNDAAHGRIAGGAMNARISQPVRRHAAAGNGTVRRGAILSPLARLWQLCADRTEIGNALTVSQTFTVVYSGGCGAAAERLLSGTLRVPIAGLTLSKLPGIEGAAAATYFQVWPSLPTKWKGLGKRPIPENWGQTIPRTMGWRKRARQARHPVNAMLNYGYGILATQLRTQLVAAGLDPTIGVIHERKDNPIPLVYDLMEPLRPLVDRAVLQFALSHIFTPGGFHDQPMGWVPD